jgi:hypothetical protein
MQQRRQGTTTCSCSGASIIILRYAGVCDTILTLAVCVGVQLALASTIAGCPSARSLCFTWVVACRRVG